jgi:small-conductance mechanosensitive channel
MAGELDLFGLRFQLPAPLDNEAGVFLVTVVIFAALAMSVYYLLGPAARALAGRSPNRIDDRVLKALDGSVFVLIVLFGARYSLDGLVPLFGEGRVGIVEAMLDVVIVVVLAYAVYRVFREVICHSLESLQSKGRELVVPLLDRLGALFIGLLALTAIGARLGVDLSALLVGGAFLGIVVGLAAQETLGNLFAGISLVLDRPFRVGDWLELSTGEVVEVREIGLRSSRLYHPYDSSTIVMPNTVLATTKITNAGPSGGPTRIVVRFRAPYTADPAEVAEILEGAAGSVEGVLLEKGRRPTVRLGNFNDSAVVYEVLLWVVRIERRWEVASNIRALGLQRLAKAGHRPAVIGNPPKDEDEDGDEEPDEQAVTRDDPARAADPEASGPAAPDSP